MGSVFLAMGADSAALLLCSDCAERRKAAITRCRLRRRAWRPMRNRQVRQPRRIGDACGERQARKADGGRQIDRGELRRRNCKRGTGGSCPSAVRHAELVVAVRIGASGYGWHGFGPPKTHRVEVRSRTAFIPLLSVRSAPRIGCNERNKFRSTTEQPLLPGVAEVGRLRKAFRAGRAWLRLTGGKWIHGTVRKTNHERPGAADRAMTVMRDMMTKLKLTVNETKTQVRRVPEDSHLRLSSCCSFPRWSSRERT